MHTWAIGALGAIGAHRSPTQTMSLLLVLLVVIAPIAATVLLSWWLVRRDSRRAVAMSDADPTDLAPGMPRPLDAPGSGRAGRRRLSPAPKSRTATAGNVIGPQPEPVDVPETRFSDVAGADEAVDELAELVRFLKNPAEFAEVGAQLPAGYLLVGPPGTGKTLLARAVAGEAGVPFFAISASQFVETYVGVGAARIRSLFQKARSSERAIVFIDELDAIGRSRGSHALASNEERESALNQLLVEMDGFVESSVVVLAATNRVDILDPALLRPGRFDRQITVAPPDRRGRTRILELYLERRKVEPGIDLEMLGRRTPGFSGADLANLVNTAALIAVRRGSGVIELAHIDDALATVTLGPARKSRVVAERDRRITAWHESGHALAGLWLEDAQDPVQVTIVPRGPAGGVTWFPASDDDFMSLRQAKAQLVVAMSGRVAEELYLGEDFTQGASNDIKNATELALAMVTEFGMSALGPIYVPPEQQHIGFLAEQVHGATRALLDEALEASRKLLGAGRAALDAVATALLDEETLDTDALRRIAGDPPALGA